FQFALPVFAMLFRSFKREPRRLAWLCAVVLIAHWAESLWLIEPLFRSDEVPVHWMDAVALLAIGGLWLARVLFLHAEPPVLPAPRLLQPSPVEGPALQPDPKSELEAYRASQQSLLHAYRWVDRSRGVVQIPIEQAMRLTAERSGALGDAQ